MNRTFAFVKMDYLIIKQSLTLKTLLLFFFVFSFITFGTRDSLMVVSMLMMYGSIYATTPFSCCEKNGMDILYASLPAKKSNVVTGRYLFAMSFNIITSILAFFASWILSFLLKKDFVLQESLILISLGFLLFSLLTALQIPIYFKLGYEKAKLVALLPLTGFPAIVIGATSVLGEDSLMLMFNDISAWMNENSQLALLFLLIIWFCLIMISYHFSFTFYQKKEC